MILVTTIQAANRMTASEMIMEMTFSGEVLVYPPPRRLDWARRFPPPLRWDGESE